MKLEQAVNDLSESISPPSTKRKRVLRIHSTNDIDADNDELPQVTKKLEDADLDDISSAKSLAERVKRRRRMITRSNTGV
jgi:hypothetical protein